MKKTITFTRLKRLVNEAVSSGLEQRNFELSVAFNDLYEALADTQAQTDAMTAIEDYPADGVKDSEYRKVLEEEVAPYINGLKEKLDRLLSKVGGKPAGNKPDLLEGIVYGNDETDESVKESPRIGKDCYAVNFRNMRTAVHGLFIGTKREMEEVMDILDQIGHTDDPADLEVLYDELGQYDTIEEINFRDIGKDYTYRDWKTDKTYEVLNSSSYDVEW